MNTPETAAEHHARAGATVGSYWFDPKRKKEAEKAPTLEIRGGDRRLGPLFRLDVEDVLPALRKVAALTGKLVSLHRTTDGKKLAVAAPSGRRVETEDVADAEKGRRG